MATGTAAASLPLNPATQGLWTPRGQCLHQHFLPNEQIRFFLLGHLDFFGARTAWFCVATYSWGQLSDHRYGVAVYAVGDSWVAVMTTMGQ